MSKHFNLMDFLRRAPKELLATYCDRQGILRNFEWGAGKRVDESRVAEALKAESEQASERTRAVFRSICDLHGPGFTKGVLNEAKFHDDPAAYQTLFGLTHLGKAFWATLERPEWAFNAKILSDVDKLPARAWIKRPQLPRRPGPVEQPAIDSLEAEVVKLFTEREQRGRNCKVDCLRSGGDEIFYTYAEDHPDTGLFWQDGRLKAQLLHPSFNLVFRHNDERRTLDIYHDGNLQLVPELQQAFARAVLGEEIPREVPSDDLVYDIDLLLQSGFEFQYPAELGISDVRIAKMRFTLDGEPWRRFTAEADNRKTRDALDDFVARLTERLPKSLLLVDQVCIKVFFHKRDGDRKPHSRECYITIPNSLRLKKDDLGERIERMLVLSGVERTAVDDDAQQ